MNKKKENNSSVSFEAETDKADNFCDECSTGPSENDGIKKIPPDEAEIFSSSEPADSSSALNCEPSLTDSEIRNLRLVEKELRNTKDLLENIIDSSTSAIIASDIRGHIRVWNKSAEKMLGYSRSEAFAQLNVWDFFLDDMDTIMNVLRSGEKGEPGKIEEYPVHVLHKNRERIPATLSATVLYENGKEIATVNILTDIRERIRIEEKLLKAQERLMQTEKQVMLAELAGTTAHELNQPLTSILGYAEILKHRITSNDSNRRAVDIVLRESERMAEIVRKIGRITRHESKNYMGNIKIMDLDRSSDND